MWYHIDRRERVGIVFALLSALFQALFPVVVNRGVAKIPPITFVALSTFFAAMTTLLWAILRGRTSEFLKKEVYKPIVLVAFCLTIFPYSLLFIGAQFTSGINTSVLLLSEIIFMLLFTPFIGEKTTLLKVLGAGSVFIGAFFLLYRGDFVFNAGDLLVIGSTALLPVGNFYAKKTLNLVSPVIALCMRFLIASFFLLLFAYFAEPNVNLVHIAQQYPLWILLNGVVLLGIGKLVWYGAFTRLDISKAISLVMIYPLFSIIILVTIFHEPLFTNQVVGIIFMLAGAYFSIRRKSVDPRITRYAPDSLLEV